MGFFDGAFGGIAGGLVSGIGSLFGASKANNSAKEIAAENNRLAVELASTQHQREVADLKAAGLNPILSAAGGGSAVPQLTVAPVQNELAGASEAVNTGLRSAQVKAQLDNLKADTASKTESATLAKENQDVSRQQGQKLIADYWKTDAEKNLTRQLEINAKKENTKKDKEIQLLEAQTSSARNSARLSSLDAEAAEYLGVKNKIIQQGAGSARAVGEAGGALIDIFKPKFNPNIGKPRPYVH